MHLAFDMKKSKEVLSANGNHFKISMNTRFRYMDFTRKGSWCTVSEFRHLRNIAFEIN